MELGTIRWTDRLPPEVWQIVLSFTTFGTNRNCLSVSKLFHNLAARMLFSSLRIQFGSWRIALRCGPGKPSAEESFTNVCKPYDVLLRVINDPVFASYIKHVDILPFGRMVAESKIGTLTQAVSAMYNLRSFTWHNWNQVYMFPSSQLLETLASKCGHLREYKLPFQSLHMLHALQSMPATDIYLCRYDRGASEFEEELYDAHRESFVSLLEARRGSLAQLSLSSPGIRDCPTYILQDLTHLTICIDEERNIAVIFRHCTRLEALFLEITKDIPHTVFTAAIAEDPSALPLLTHLKVFLSPGCNRVDSWPIANFIRSKKKLRCLDYVDKFNSIMQQSRVLSAIKSLSTLEVLGLSFTQEILEPIEWTFLTRTIPRTVTALRLSVDYDDLGRHCEWIDLWASLPRLSFAHVADLRFHPIVGTRALAAAAKSLRLVGHHSYFREVYRTGDKVTFSKPWSPTKVKFRMAAEFGCDDWEWLMRDHRLQWILRDSVGH
ncbi:uncharacterized protein C8Q71DRAFT_862943 [Rhodofomes roseus]|uniref:F-box domain-containing protein n=1 Tax=Rhodofomes roseus TaxID=34475 RepID=A0ABQ8JZR0_9APHY|nr:uncharacterized protein C8Q71DRAFT_862943 [Rhodofomes roseus]KAH9829836.1 hypothetical protein C8Q71DRAFT_862943 [Rhodofomes roseus]